MYQVLLADDKPIIRSGLQSVVRWEDHGCVVAGSVRDGEQALEFIRRRRPHIVICDIDLPRLNGLELLSRCAEEYPKIVFIMLTDRADFGTARESMRHRAADYLLKTDLDEGTLAAALKRAVRSCGYRNAPHQAGPGRDDGGGPDAGSIRHWVEVLLQGGEGSISRAVLELKKQGAAVRCMAVDFVVVRPGQAEGLRSLPPEEEARRFLLCCELADRLAQKFLPHGGHVVLPRDGAGGLLYLWDVESADHLGRFQRRMDACLRDLALVRASLLVTEILPEERLPELRAQLAALRAVFDAAPRPILHYGQLLGHSDYVTRAKQYVERHILERVQLQDAAAALGITPNYLSHCFKRQTGQNFIDYVNAAKIRWACVLLENGGMQVGEIARMLGYESAYYFTRLFKRQMDATPTGYRARCAR